MILSFRSYIYSLHYSSVYAGKCALKILDTTQIFAVSKPQYMQRISCACKRFLCFSILNTFERVTQYRSCCCHYRGMIVWSMYPVLYNNDLASHPHSECLKTSTGVVRGYICRNVVCCFLFFFFHVWVFQLEQPTE